MDWLHRVVDQKILQAPPRKLNVIDVEGRLQSKCLRWRLDEGKDQKCPYGEKCHPSLGPSGLLLAPFTLND